MEFKGTKGKWEAVANGCVWEIVACDTNKKSICAVNNTLKEVNANALLISKAPEMLELLMFFVNQFENMFHESTETDNKIKECQQLIKEATEI